MTGRHRTPTVREASQGAGTPIPLFDLRLDAADIAAVTDALRSGWLTMGPRIEAFERAFAEHLGARHAVAVSSCTAALHLAYRAAGVGPGDEVITVPFTFVATTAAIVYCGARPVFVDIDPLTFNIDARLIEENITSRTKAIMRVHLFG